MIVSWIVVLVLFSFTCCVRAIDTDESNDFDREKFFKMDEQAQDEICQQIKLNMADKATQIACNRTSSRHTALDGGLTNITDHTTQAGDTAADSFGFGNVTESSQDWSDRIARAGDTAIDSAELGNVTEPSEDSNRMARAGDTDADSIGLGNVTEQSPDSDRVARADDTAADSSELGDAAQPSQDSSDWVAQQADERSSESYKIQADVTPLVHFWGNATAWNKYSDASKKKSCGVCSRCDNKKTKNKAKSSKSSEYEDIDDEDNHFKSLRNEEDEYDEDYPTTPTGYQHTDHGNFKAVNDDNAYDRSTTDYDNFGRLGDDKHIDEPVVPWYCTTPSASDESTNPDCSEISSTPHEHTNPDCSEISSTPREHTDPDWSEEQTRSTLGARKCSKKKSRKFSKCRDKSSRKSKCRKCSEIENKSRTTTGRKCSRRKSKSNFEDYLFNLKVELPDQQSDRLEIIPYSANEITIDPFNIRDSRKRTRVRSALGGLTSHAGFFKTNEQQDARLFFWFFQSEKNWKTAPTIVWLQGEPGWSSLYGLFEEHGPYYITNTTNGLKMNLRKFAWTKMYNVLYLDHCIGCGFSLATDEDAYIPSYANVGENVYEALYQFFKVFPEYTENDLYLAGSHGGAKYIPVIGHAIHTNNRFSKVQMHLKGMFIGGPYTDAANMIYYSNVLEDLRIVDSVTASRLQMSEYVTEALIHAGKYQEAIDFLNENTFPLIKKAGYEILYDARYKKPANDTYMFEKYVPELVKTVQFRNMIYLKRVAFRHQSTPLIKEIMPSVGNLLPELLDNYKMLYYVGRYDLMAPISSMHYINTIPWDGIDRYFTFSYRKWCATNNTWYNQWPDDCSDGVYKNYKTLTTLELFHAGHTYGSTNSEQLFYLLKAFVENKFEHKWLETQQPPFESSDLPDDSNPFGR